MRKVSLFAIAAAMVAIGVGVWAASTTKAGVAPSMVQGIEPFQLMMNAKDLPAQHYDDFSMGFHLNGPKRNFNLSAIEEWPTP